LFFSGKVFRSVEFFCLAVPAAFLTFLDFWVAAQPTYKIAGVRIGGNLAFSITGTIAVKTAPGQPPLVGIDPPHKND
jgi:hypothetical protein